MNHLRQVGLYERIIAEYTGYSGCPLLCREESAAVSSNKLFTSAPALWALTTELGLNQPHDLEGYVFDEAEPAGGEAADTLRFDWQLNNTVTEWRYDAETRTYARWIDTAAMPELAPHVDAANGQALRASTVVLIFASYAPANVREVEGGTVYYSYDIALAGSGEALVFRDGQMLAAAWERPEADGGLPRLVDDAGRPIAFRPGQIWFALLDPDSPRTFTGSTFQIRSKVPRAVP
jgi:hypothetical protein